MWRTMGTVCGGKCEGWGGIGKGLLLCFDTFRILVRDRVRERWEREERVREGREGGKGENM